MPSCAKRSAQYDSVGWMRACLAAVRQIAWPIQIALRREPFGGIKAQSSPADRANSGQAGDMLKAARMTQLRLGAR
jgi:hypothetical protein